MKTLLLILLPFFGMTQSKWWHIDGNDIGIMLSQAVSGGFDGWNQNISHHHWGQGKPFWDADQSWKRKYKDYDNGDTRSAYPFSKNILAFTTDGFHMTRTVSRAATLVTIGITAADFKDYPKNQRWLVVAKKVALSIVINRAFFSIVYN